jgi:hypothetical protein
VRLLFLWCGWCIAGLWLFQGHLMTCQIRREQESHLPAGGFMKYFTKWEMKISRHI